VACHLGERQYQRIGHSAGIGGSTVTQRIEILVDMEDMSPDDFEKLRKQLEDLVWNAVDVETGPLMVQANEVVAP